MLGFSRFLYGPPRDGGWPSPSAFPSAAKPPKPPAPVEMPDLLDPSQLAAKRRREMDAMSRSGRASTMLTADDYSANKLGTS